jgi:hypothetical protein
VFGRRLPAPHTGNLASLTPYRRRREYLLIPPIASVASTFEGDSNIADRVITQNKLASSNRFARFQAIPIGVLRRSAASRTHRQRSLVNVLCVCRVSVARDQ